MNALHDFAARRARAADALDRLATAIEATMPDPDAVHLLRGTADRARRGRFHVQLVGCFSSGKSTLLNALVGEPVLPAKVNPCTAILTELVYGDKPSVDVILRDGTTQTMDVGGFLREYQLTTPDPVAAGREVDKFAAVERAIVRFPLPLLADGVVLLDSPGLDDDESRTARTIASLPDADAVIVVLSAARFLTELERRILRRELLPLGLTNLFFPVTMVDLLASLSDDPERALREMQDRAKLTLGPLCTVDGADRFPERFFLLDARGALTSRYDRVAARRREPADQAGLQRSGIPAFEQALERFLVAERGSAQLRHLRQVAHRTAGELRRRAELDRATADASVAELRRRQDELVPRFGELEAISRRVARIVDAFVGRQQVAVHQDLRSFLARTEAELPEAIMHFDLGNTATLDLLAPGGRQRVEARIREQLDAWLAEKVAAWQQATRPRMEEAIRGLRAELAGESADFDAIARGIVTDFAGGLLSAKGAADDRTEPDAVERWFSVALGAVLLSPGMMAAGFYDGYEGALKGATGRLGARLALVALGALLGPIGWAGLLLYVVSDLVLLSLTGGGQLKRLRDQVADGMRGRLVSQADAAKDDVAVRVAEALQPLRDGIVGAAENEAHKLSAQLEQIIAARELAVRDAEGRRVTWEALLGEIERGLAEIEVEMPPAAG